MSWNQDYGYDPQDSRFSDGYGHNGYGNMNNGYPYAAQLDIEGSSETQGYAPPPGYQQPQPSYPDIFGNLSNVVGSLSGGSSSRRWRTSESGFGTSRGITEWTDPDMGASRFVPTGPKCIFHWINCTERFADYNDWVEHVDSHLPPPHPSQPGHRRDFAGMPYSWTCGFPYCGFNIGNQSDHRQMWDDKLGHIFEHLQKGCKPEDNRELDAWMRFYQKLRLCSEADANGHLIAPPTHEPYKSPHNEFRKPPKKQDKKDSRHSPLPPGAPFPAPPPHAQQLPSPGATGNHAPPVHNQQFSPPSMYMAPGPVHHQGEPTYQLAHQPQPGYQVAPYGSAHPPVYPGFDPYAPDHIRRAFTTGHMYPPPAQPVQQVEPYPGYPNAGY
ncbi:hypothetical protein TWF696_005086 [Orbilia brochopaga]|uniref:C2H2-type domain-containing protein n=1 Tax=Orbilia brochopaga TaxID=3140254 RepID=A0AAV9UZN2_9PEZI